MSAPYAKLHPVEVATELQQCLHDAGQSVLAELAAQNLKNVRAACAIIDIQKGKLDAKRPV